MRRFIITFNDIRGDKGHIICETRTESQRVVGELLLSGCSNVEVYKADKMEYNALCHVMLK